MFLRLVLNIVSAIEEFEFEIYIFEEERKCR